MELWDVYDIDRIKTGETLARGDKFNPGQYHIVIHAAIFNSNGEMLIQKRTAEKELFPLRWDISVGGSALAGETTRDACERETWEELGIKLDLDGCRPTVTLNFFPGFDDFYIIKEDVDLDKLVLQKEEVSDVMWANKETILKMVDSEEFTPNMENFIGLLFELKNFCALKNVIRGYKSDEKISD